LCKENPNISWQCFIGPGKGLVVCVVELELGSDFFVIVDGVSVLSSMIGKVFVRGMDEEDCTEDIEESVDGEDNAELELLVSEELALDSEELVLDSEALVLDSEEAGFELDSEEELELELDLESEEELELGSEDALLVDSETVVGKVVGREFVLVGVVLVTVVGGLGV